MGAAFHMPCPLKQWFSACHCPYGLSRLWDPLPFYLTYGRLTPFPFRPSSDNTPCIHRGAPDTSHMEENMTPFAGLETFRRVLLLI